MAASVALLLLAGTVPTAHADPLDFISGLTDRTVAYVQGFDPSDNATAQQARTEAYLNDVDDLGDLLGYLLCAHFQLGPWNLSVVPQAHYPSLEVRWDVPGFGFQGSRAGFGTYKFEANQNGSGACSLPLLLPVDVGDLIKTKPGA
ncbi:MAG: hypothetical protein ABR586_03315 [Thermoplasmatota archaeon]